MYEPCPICFRCKVKASHLYVKCQDCQVPICRHSDKNRNMMIRRENFAIKTSQLGPDAIEGFRNLIRAADEVCNCEEEGDSDGTASDPQTE
jgi:hypothetical protein